jgi:hypothetical protein
MVEATTIHFIVASNIQAAARTNNIIHLPTANNPSFFPVTNQPAAHSNHPLLYDPNGLWFRLFLVPSFLALTSCEGAVVFFVQFTSLLTIPSHISRLNQLPSADYPRCRAC